MGGGLEWGVSEVSCLGFIFLFSFQVGAVAGLGIGVLFQLFYWSFVALGILKTDRFLVSLMLFTHSTLPSVLSQVWVHRKVIAKNLDFILLASLPSALTNLVGSFLLTRIQNAMVIRLCGSLLICLFLFTLYSDYSRRTRSMNQNQPSNHHSSGVSESSPIRTDPNQSAGAVTQTADDEEEHMNEAATLRGPSFGSGGDSVTVSDKSVSKSKLLRSQSSFSLVFERPASDNIQRIRLDSWQSRTLIVSASLCAGVLGGLLGLGGLPWMVLAVAMNVPRDLMTAMMPVQASFGLTVWIVSFTLGNKQNRSKQRHSWIPIVICIVSGLIGTTIGKCFLYDKVSQKDFRRIVQFVMLGGGVNMLLFQTPVQSYVSLILVTVVLSAFVWLLLRSFLQWRSQLNQGGSEHGTNSEQVIPNQE